MTVTGIQMILIHACAILVARVILAIASSTIRKLKA